MRVRLGDVCKIQANNDPLAGKQFWLLNLDMVEQQTGNIIAYNYVPSTELGGSIIQFDSDTVLYSKLRPNLNKVVLPQQSGYATSEMLPLKPDKSLLCKEYLAAYLRSDSFVAWASSKTSGAKMPRLGTQELLSKEFPLPSLEEQAHISKLFSKIDTLISLRKQQLAKVDELVKARFVELFGDPKHSDKYGTRKLSSCVANKSDMVDGPFGSQVNTKVDYIENGEIPVIRTVNVKMMQFNTDDLKFMSRQKYETVIRSQVLPGDVILTKVGTIGNVCVFPNEYQEAVLSTTGSCRIRVDESIVNKVFFAYNLMYLKDKLLEIASTGVQPFLNMNHIKNIDVLDVPLEQQTLFTAFVEHTDKSKSAIQQSLDKLETLKKALMQKYFG